MNVGRWDSWYEPLDHPIPYGPSLASYEKGAAWLEGLQVEDWGCGAGWFRRYVSPELYRGVDGSHSRFADEVVDLTTYRSQTEGLFMRHVLEHNYEWLPILRNAVGSFQRRMVLAIFTPFAETTKVLTVSEMGVPDLSLPREEVVAEFGDATWTSEEDVEADLDYGVEHIFYLSRE